MMSKRLKRLLAILIIEMLMFAVILEVRSFDVSAAPKNKTEVASSEKGSKKKNQQKETVSTAPVVEETETSTATVHEYMEEQTTEAIQTESNEGVTETVATGTEKESISESETTIDMSVEEKTTEESTKDTTNEETTTSVVTPEKTETTTEETTTAEATPSATASKYSNLTASEFVIKMGMGWNLGNSLDCASATAGYKLNTETMWKNPVVTKDLLKAVKDAGFTSVRIPVTYLNHIDKNGVIDPQWFDRVEEVVNYALDEDLIVIINIHHDTGLNAKYRWIYADNTTTNEDVEKITNLWSQIADRFKNYDERLVFEAANEIEGLSNEWSDYDNFDAVHAINQAFISTVRAVGGYNSNRFLALANYAAGSLVEQAEGALAGGYVDTVNNKLMFAFHLYKSDVAGINRASKRVIETAAKYNMPVYIGEFGTKSSEEEQSVRVTAAAEYAKLAKTYGIACFWWDNGTDYALFDRNDNSVINQELVDALVK